MEQHIKRLAVGIKAGFANDENMIDLPIKEIDGVKVQVRIIFTYRTKRMELIIWAKTNLDNNNDPEVYHNKIWGDYEVIDGPYPPTPHLNHYTNSDIVMALTKLHETLQKMTFNKFEGKMIVTPNMNIEEDWTKILSTGKVVLSCEPCAVCHDLTTTTTSCNHYLCYTCWSHLKPSICDDCCGTCRTMRCPICRESIDNDDD